MAKKRYDTTIDLTWDGETRIDTFLGKEVVVSSANETWDGTSALWTDDVISIVEYVLWGGSRGGVRKQWDQWNAWNKLNEKDKKKIVRVILYHRGVKFVSERNINEYMNKVTVDDIKLLADGYEKYKVSVSEIKIRN